MKSFVKFSIAVIILMSSFVIAFAAGEVSSGSPEHVLKISGIAEQTENKGDLLIVKNFKAGLSQSIFNKIINFYMNCNKNSMVISFEKDETVKMFFTQGILISNSETGEFAANLSIPIPVELENGKYNVRAHQLNDIWSGGYTELVFEFELNVTDADTENVRPFKLNKIVGFKDNTPFLTTDGNSDARPEVMLKEKVSAAVGNIEGYALDENGWVYSLGATGTGMAIMITEGIGELPVGRYKCYFYISGELYGPLELKVAELSFNEKYYSSSSKQVTISLGKSAAKKIPDRTENFILSMDFKNSNGESVHKIEGIEVVEFSAGNNGMEFACELSFAGIVPGLYDVDVMFDRIMLGSDELCITEKTIINGVSVLNYGDMLTTDTKSFYVKLTTPDLFLDYKKININLLSPEGEVVAQTVSKEAAELFRHDGSTLIYKLNVTGNLEESYRLNEQYGYDYFYYTLDIQSQEDANLILNIDKVYISVAQNARVVRSCFTDKHTVEIYTENIEPGEYSIVDLGDNQRVYDITIDEQGKGIFGLANIDRLEGVFRLRRAESTITEFTIRMENNKDFFVTNPGFILAGCMEMERFFLSGVFSDDDIPTAEGIEHARFVQSGETIAAMSNFEIDIVSYSDGELGSRIDFYGDISLLPGKSFTVGKAMFEIKYKSGSLYTNTVTVTDETTGLYGSMKLGNSGQFNINVGGYKCTQAVGDNKVSFNFEKTNITEGTITLYEYTSAASLEVLNLADLDKIDGSGWYSYKGSFNVELSEGVLYGIRVFANGKTENYGSFVYYNGKTARQTESLTAYNGECLISLEHLINIFDFQSLIVEAIVDDVIYPVPVIENYACKNGGRYLLDFSAIPTGYFCIEVYDGAHKIDLRGITSGYNYGNINSPKVIDATWRWTNELTREYGVSGINLDTIQELSIKLYKYTDFPEAEYGDDKRKLKYIKDFTISKPYNENYIAITPQILSEIETGIYLVVYLIDGEAVISQKAYMKRKEPVYEVSVVISDGEEVTDKTVVHLAISFSGYTKMKIAFSEEDLESAEYQPISSSKIVSVEGKYGTINIYVWFANDDESKTELVRERVMVKIKEPLINNVNIPDLKLWKTSEVMFSSNKLLQSAVITIGRVNEENGVFEGTNYEFSLKEIIDDYYIYSCTVYVDSMFLNSGDLKAQIVVCDKAGNEVKTDIIALRFSNSCNISGKVTTEGKEIATMEIYLYDENRELLQYTYTNHNGEYTFYDIAKGNYIIEAKIKGYELAELWVMQDEFKCDITGKDFDLIRKIFDKSTITITVKDYSGKAINGVSLCVYSADYKVNVSAKADETGVAKITVPCNMEDTFYSVYASHKDYAEIKDITVNSEYQNVEITFLRNAQIRGAIMVSGKKVKFVFTRPVNPDSVRGDAFKIFDEEGEGISGEILFAENNKVLLFKPLKEMTDGYYKAVVSGIRDAEDNVIPQEEISFKKQAGIIALDYPDILYNLNGSVTIAFPDGKIPVNEEEIVIKLGESPVSGTLCKSGNIVTFIPDATFMSATMYSVCISEAIRTDTNEYLAEDFKQTFVVPGRPSPEINADSSGGNVPIKELPEKSFKYKDIEGYEWAHEAISVLSEQGIIKGISESEFAPAQEITRADYILLLIRMLGIDANVTDNFDDVDINKYYYEGIGIAKKLGLTSGVGNNKFNPDASITRQDMFLLAYRTLKMQKVFLEETGVSEIYTFADYDKIATYAKTGLAVLAKNGLIKGWNNNINPIGNASRAETAVFIYRLYNLFNTKMKLSLEIERV